MTTFEVGDVIAMDDRDYKYGTGRLILRVTRIGYRTYAADGEWLEVDGLELRPDGTQIGRQPRRAAVRVGTVRVL